MEKVGNKINKIKAISPIIATSLLLVVTILAVLGFKIWNDNFQSNILSDVERQLSLDMQSNIDLIDEETLYFNNHGNNKTMISLTIFNKPCNITGQEILKKGINFIDITSCLPNQGNFYEVVLQTTQKTYSRKYFVMAKNQVLAGTPSLSSPWMNSSPNIYYDVGNVGINTQTPSGNLKLDVDGQIGATEYCDQDGNNCVNISKISSIPQGSIIFFNGASCPDGYSEVTDARGRYLVGTPNGGTTGVPVGTALTDLENRATGLHDHNLVVSNLGGTESTPGTNGADTLGATKKSMGAGDFLYNSQTPNTNLDTNMITTAGNVAGTNAPYLQYLVCQKTVSTSGGNTAASEGWDFSGSIVHLANISNTVSIGTTTTNADLKLDVDGNIGAQKYCDQNGANCQSITDLANINIWSNNGNDIYYNNGNIGIGTTTPAQTLDVNGNIAVSGTTVHTSDIRYKENIQPLQSSLDKITKINGVTYNWKDKNKDQKTQIGVIAQDVETVFPELVYKDENGYKSVAYSNLVAPLIESVKELKKRNEMLEVELCKKDNTYIWC